jgi:hypothetical protein
MHYYPKAWRLLLRINNSKPVLQKLNNAPRGDLRKNYSCGDSPVCRSLREFWLESPFSVQTQKTAVSADRAKPSRIRIPDDRIPFRQDDR